MLLRLLLLVAVAGCASSPIEGNWISVRKLGNGQFNALAVFKGNTADATIHATPSSSPNNWVKFYFEASWSRVGDGFDFQMTCKKGPCDKDDFRMSCQVIDENNGEVYKLDCKANNKWQDYPLDWQQDI
jgi:hypothetical protein